MKGVILEDGCRRGTGKTGKTEDWVGHEGVYRETPYRTEEESLTLTMQYKSFRQQGIRQPTYYSFGCKIL